MKFFSFSVRQKCKELIDFIQDDDKLRDERKKAKKTKDKYIGMASDNHGHKYSKSSFTLGIFFLLIYLFISFSTPYLKVIKQIT